MKHQGRAVETSLPCSTTWIRLACKARAIAEQVSRSRRAYESDPGRPAREARFYCPPLVLQELPRPADYPPVVDTAVTFRWASNTRMAICVGANTWVPVYACHPGRLTGWTSLANGAVLTDSTVLENLHVRDDGNAVPTPPSTGPLGDGPGDNVPPRAAGEDAELRRESENYHAQQLLQVQEEARLLEEYQERQKQEFLEKQRLHLQQAHQEMLQMQQSERDAAARLSQERLRISNPNRMIQDVETRRAAQQQREAAGGQQSTVAQQQQAVAAPQQTAADADAGLAPPPGLGPGYPSLPRPANPRAVPSPAQLQQMETDASERE